MVSFEMDTNGLDSNSVWMFMNDIWILVGL